MSPCVDYGDGVTVWVVYCKHGYRGNCPACGRIIVMRWP